jgi:hypothetical protein
MPTTVLLINGSPVAVPASVLLGRMTVYTKDGYPTLSFFARGGALAGLPDPYLGKTVELRIDDVTYFKGDVTHGPDAQFDQRHGWIRGYQCMGLRNRMDWIPHTDEATGTDQTGFNLAVEDPDRLLPRTGRTVGEVLEAVLTMPTNADLLDELGIGGYTSLSPPTLPTATQDDLDALTLIPPSPVYFQGEKLGSAVESFLAVWAPNHAFHVRPDGVMRFLDLREFDEHVFTINSDPIEPTPLSRSVSENFQRVVVRGSPWVQGVLLSLAAGDLAEDFAYGALDNEAAKAAWTPDDFTQPGLDADGPNTDSGSANCTSTTTVVVTSAEPARSWDSNFWDQTGTGRGGVIYLRDSINANLTQFAVRRVISNTALTPAGTSTLTLDQPLPHTDYDEYTLIGTTGGAANVWRKYSVVNTEIAAKLTNRFSFPQPFRMAAGNAVTMTSHPIGSVVFDGLAEATLAFTADPDSGTILFAQPTYIVAGNQEPDDVRALVGVNFGVNRAISPPDAGETPQYDGTSYTVEGLTKTLAVTVDAWRDPINAAQMQTFADEILDSVKDTIVEGSITYYGLLTEALTPGLAASVTGDGYTTGWEDLALPIIECAVEWPQDLGVNHVTLMRCSNRRAQLSSAAFLRPDRTFLGLDFGGGEIGMGLVDAAAAYGAPAVDPFGFGGAINAMVGGLDPSGAVGSLGSGLVDAVGSLAAGNFGGGPIDAGMDVAGLDASMPLPAMPPARRASAPTSEPSRSTTGDQTWRKLRKNRH